MPEFRMTHTAEAHGSGSILAGELAAVLANMPPKARVTITETKGDQRDPGGWHVKATWTQAEQEQWQKPQPTFQPR